MMNRWSRQRQTDLEEKRTRRGEREDTAGKLLDRVPNLATLALEIHEARPDGCLGENQYIRRVVVEHAPALFEIACTYPDCEDGGYDLTREILSGLASRRDRFGGEHSCRGRCRTVDCTRVLKYVAIAAYR